MNENSQPVKEERFDGDDCDEAEEAIVMEVQNIKHEKEKDNCEEVIDREGETSEVGQWLNIHNETDQFISTVGETSVKNELKLTPDSSLTYHDNPIYTIDTEITKIELEIGPDTVLEEEVSNARHFVCGVCCDTFDSSNLLETHAIVHTKSISNIAATKTAIETKKNSFEFVECNFTAPELCNSKESCDKLFKCDECKFKTGHISELKTHVMIHTGEVQFKCDECSYKTASISELKLHVNLHTVEGTSAGGSSSFKTLLNCHFCDFKSPNFSDIKSHLKLKHLSKQSLIFDNCSKKALKKKAHSSDKQFKCDMCTYEFVSSSLLKSHKKSHTKKQNMFECDQCSYKTANSSYLKMHKTSHLDDNLFKCDLCDFKSFYHNSLKHHKMLHTGEKPFKCDKCDYKTVQLTLLKKHKMTHLAEKPFKCDLCDFKSIYPYSFKSHKMSHAGEKPFECDECHCKFVNREQLKGHQKKHSDRKPYKCDQCNYAAKRSSHLSRHKKTHSAN